MINLPTGPIPRLARGFPLFIFTFLIYLIAAAILPAPARAAMFASDDDGYLKRIDQTTGIVTPVGPMGIPGPVKGLSASPCWFTLYGAETEVTYQLWTIDILTGAGTPVGPFGYPVRELAYDYFNDVLYGTDYSNLFTICQESGAASPIGPLVAEEDDRMFTWALDFDTASGRLYGVDRFLDQLFWADPSTGAATLVGEWYPGTGREDITDIAFDWQTGLLYGIEIRVDPDYFFRVDKETGTTTNIGPLGEPIHVMGLAKPIPEPTTLILLGAGLLLGLRRKKGRRPLKGHCRR